MLWLVKELFDNVIFVFCASLLRFGFVFANIKPFCDFIKNFFRKILLNGCNSHNFPIVSETIININFLSEVFAITTVTFC